MIHITAHALSRAIERIPGVESEDQARALLTGRAIHAAVKFGARFVRLGTGHRVLIRDNAVITVLPVNQLGRDAMDRLSGGKVHG